MYIYCTDSRKGNARHDIRTYIGTARAASDGRRRLPSCILSAKGIREEKEGGIEKGVTRGPRGNCQFHQSGRVTFELPLQVENYIFRSML